MKLAELAEFTDATMRTAVSFSLCVRFRFATECTRVRCPQHVFRPNQSIARLDFDPSQLRDVSGFARWFRLSAGCPWIPFSSACMAVSFHCRMHIGSMSAACLQPVDISCDMHALCFDLWCSWSHWVGKAQELLLCAFPMTQELYDGTQIKCTVA